LIAKKYSYQLNLFRENNYFKFYNFVMFQKKEFIVYELQNENLLENLDYSIFNNYALII
jgi:hypothetical protein